MKVNGFRCVDLMAPSSSAFCVQHSRWIRCWAGAVQQSSEWHLSKSLFENFNLVSPTSRKILVNENIYKTKNQAAHFFSKLLKSRSAPFNLFEMVISFLFNKFSTNSKIGLTNAIGKINQSLYKTNKHKSIFFHSSHLHYVLPKDDVAIITIATTAWRHYITQPIMSICISYHLMPRVKKTLWILHFCFCRRRESNLCHLSSNQVLCPLLHCLSTSIKTSLRTIFAH